METPLDSVNPIALELGHIIITWAMIEGAITELIVELARLDEEQIADIVCGDSVDLRAKIQMLKGLCFVRKRSDDWMTATVAILDHIDNELRPKRNLFIHSRWVRIKKHSKYPIAMLRSKKTKLFKPRSFTLALETRQQHRITIPEPRKFKNHLLVVLVDFMHICWFTWRPDPPEFYEDASKVDPLSFRQYLRAAGHRFQSINAFPRQKRPAKSPRKESSLAAG